MSRQLKGPRMWTLQISGEAHCRQTRANEHRCVYLRRGSRESSVDAGEIAKKTVLVVPKIMEKAWGHIVQGHGLSLTEI